MKLRFACSSLVVCFAVGLVGCESKPTMVGVTGTVTLEGKPLGLGRILFEPVSPDDGTSAMGDIEADGSFELFTTKPGDGVVPGSYYPVVMDPKEGRECTKRSAHRTRSADPKDDYGHHG